MISFIPLRSINIADNAPAGPKGKWTFNYRHFPPQYSFYVSYEGRNVEAILMNGIFQIFTLRWT